MTSKGGNADVLEACRQVFEEYRDSCWALVSGLRWDAFDKQCMEVFRIVAGRVSYKEDPGNNQLVKTPTRLLADGVGDCKSMAIFIASCMWCLGADVILRFVSFASSGCYTHVYCVAEKDGETVILDPVERDSAGRCVYNYARHYNYKKDYVYRHER